MLYNRPKGNLPIRTLCLILLALAGVATPGAAAQPQGAEPMTLERAAIDAGLTKLAWEDGIAHSVELYKPKSAKEAAADFADPGTIAGRPLLAPYQKQLSPIATLLGGLGPGTYFFYGKARALFPFAVATFNGQKCLVAYVSTGDVYDAAKLGSAKQRAANLKKATVLLSDFDQLGFTPAQLQLE